MHFYVFPMHNRADKGGEELALLRMARDKLGCQEGIAAIYGLLQRCYHPV